MGKKSWDCHSQPGALFDQVSYDFTMKQINIKSVQLEKGKGHKILKIVLSRSFRGQLNDLSFAANDWKEVRILNV